MKNHYGKGKTYTNSKALVSPGDEINFKW